jgi:hypothetical protein
LMHRVVDGSLLREARRNQTMRSPMLSSMHGLCCEAQAWAVHPSSGALSLGRRRSQASARRQERRMSRRPRCPELEQPLGKVLIASRQDGGSRPQGNQSSRWPLIRCVCGPQSQGRTDRGRVVGANARTSHGGKVSGGRRNLESPTKARGRNRQTVKEISPPVSSE